MRKNEILWKDSHKKIQTTTHMNIKIIIFTNDLKGIKSTVLLHTDCEVLKKTFASKIKQHPKVNTHVFYAYREKE